MTAIDLGKVARLLDEAQRAARVAEDERRSAYRSLETELREIERRWRDKLDALQAALERLTQRFQPREIDDELLRYSAEYLTVGQVAARLNIGPEPVRQRIRDGRLPATRLHPQGAYRIRSEDVDALFASTSKK